MPPSCSMLMVVSIHTPLAGSDIVDTGLWKLRIVSIHTPLAGSDPTHLNVEL